jgi:hypothetical protein
MKLTITSTADSASDLLYAIRDVLDEHDDNSTFDPRHGLFVTSRATLSYCVED